MMMSNPDSLTVGKFVAAAQPSIESQEQAETAARLEKLEALINAPEMQNFLRSVRENPPCEVVDRDPLYVASVSYYNGYIAGVKAEHERNGLTYKLRPKS